MSDDIRPLTRRDFIARAGVPTLALAAASVAAGGQHRPLRIAAIGTGVRGLFWCQSMRENYSDVCRIVGLCDINGKRVQAVRRILGGDVPVFADFDRMLRQTEPDMILVATTDSSHCAYIVRAMELGKDVITEKPVCTDEHQGRLILAAEKRYGRKLIVAFNARHYPEAIRIKELLRQRTIGDVISVDYHEYLDTRHGASYFRRWHRLKEHSGTLLVTKSCHHFDQVNWWLDSKPAEVIGSGDLRFYGRNNAFRSTHCRACPHTERCRFYWDVTHSPRAMELYVACESEDGYLIDGCVWRLDTDIHDTYAVMVTYENGARLTYTANTFMPFEGQEIAINGTAGRIDFKMYGGGGFTEHELRLTRNFGKSEVIKVAQRGGGHGGADPSLHDTLFRHPDGPDPLGLKAGSLAGIYSSLVGIAGCRSIEQGRERVRIPDLLKPLPRGNADGGDYDSLYESQSARLEGLPAHRLGE